MNEYNSNKIKIIKFSLIGLIATILAISILSILSIQKTNTNDLEVTGAILENNYHQIISNFEQIEQYPNLNMSCNIFFSYLYPETMSAEITTESIVEKDDNISFTLKTDHESLFYITLENQTLNIQNSRKEEIFSFNISALNQKKSPHLLDDAFPYSNTLPGNNNFTASLSSDKKNISINFPYCPSEKNIEQEAKQKVKEYIQDLNSTPDFFLYTINDLCF